MPRLKRDADGIRSDKEVLQVSLRRVPRRIYKALKVMSDLEDLGSIENAIYDVLNRDVKVRQIIAQFNVKARADAIRNAAQKELPRSVTGA